MEDPPGMFRVVEGGRFVDGPWTVRELAEQRAAKRANRVTTVQ